MQQKLNDHAYMAAALNQAKKGLYTTRVNPRVGCVIVKQDNIIGQGFHAYAGEAHAEVNALNNCTDPTQGATAYVTLEPCAHHGKTSPCCDALVQAKIERVVVAMQDPNPLVNGNGLAYLKQNKISVTSNILNNEVLELNKGFIKRHRDNLPYITVKSAISLDGKTALSTGDSKWITSDAARRDVQFLRARSCAIMTSIDTILADNPALTVRLSASDLKIEKEYIQPLRIILDTHLRLPHTVNILNQPGYNIIYTCSEEKNKIDLIQNTHTEIVKVGLESGHVSLSDVMSDLAKRDINEVLVEAGPTLTGNLVEQGFVDELIVYIAPHFLGDTSKGMLKIANIEKMQDRLNIEITKLNIVGKDIKIHAKPLPK